MTNPFEQGQQSAPQQQAPATAPNPFAGNVPALPVAQPPQGANPFAAPTPPVQQPQYAPPALAGTSYSNPYAMPPGAQHAPAVYGGPQASAPPAINIGSLTAAAPPPPTGDGKGAKFENMYGRLVMFFPHVIETKAKNPSFITDEDRRNGRLTQEQITATVIVLDDGQGGMTPIEWGGTAIPPVPHTDRAELPYVRKGMWITQSRIIGQLKPYLPQTPGGAPSPVIGRVLKNGNQHNSPWYLTSDVTEADMGLARAYLGLVEQGRYPHPLAQ